MDGLMTVLALSARRAALAAVAATAILLPAAPGPALARGPESISDVAEKVIDAVVNIWTPEALAHRPGWGPGFFVGKMNIDPARDAAVADRGPLPARRHRRRGPTRGVPLNSSVTRFARTI